MKIDRKTDSCDMIGKLLTVMLTLYLLVSPAHNRCKQIGPRSGPT